MGYSTNFVISTTAEGAAELARALGSLGLDDLARSVAGHGPDWDFQGRPCSVVRLEASLEERESVELALLGLSAPQNHVAEGEDYDDVSIDSSDYAVPRVYPACYAYELVGDRRLVAGRDGAADAAAIDALWRACRSGAGDAEVARLARAAAADPLAA